MENLCGIHYGFLGCQHVLDIKLVETHNSAYRRIYLYRLCLVLQKYDDWYSIVPTVIHLHSGLTSQGKESHDFVRPLIPYANLIEQGAPASGSRIPHAPNAWPKRKQGPKSTVVMES